ncbi:50S ribosomal protein L21 [Candidatus Saccharibacteria bacterium]|nr:50S ribosomal protein L21 [Candidatus Saccharibacteria bacterium]
MLAVIETGSKQYIVEKGQTLEVELLHAEKSTVEFKPLMIIDGENIKVGKPIVDGAIVKAEIAPEVVKGKKVVILHYKAKKRQSVKTGHRQKYSSITITDIKA